MSQGYNDFLPSKELLDFIARHLSDDVRQLAFYKHKYPDLDFPRALNAIQGGQKFIKKFPELSNRSDIFIPSTIMVEQASSLETARYKQRFIKDYSWKVLDLSGGLGMDSYAFSEKAEQVNYLELSMERVAAAHHNFKAFGADNINCYVGSAETEGVSLAKTLQPDLIFIDPDRRPEHQGRVFLLEDAMPDITELLPRLMQVSPGSAFLIKLSPIIDIDYLLRKLPYRFDIHVIGLRREAKELLIHIYPDAPLQIFSVELFHDLSMILRGAEKHTDVAVKNEIGPFIYDLYPSVAKIGIEHFSIEAPLWKPHQHTHFYFSSVLIEDFPGRKFEVVEHSNGDRRWLKQITKEPIHFMAKNLPVQTDELRKQLKIKEGGSRFLFAFGDAAGHTHYVLAHPIH